MKTKYTAPRGFTLVELLVVIVIIAALAGLSAPMILRQQKSAARTEAVSNARQVGLALLEFDQEYGSFPDDTTATDVKDATGTELSFDGGTSNDYFRQLIAFGIKSEKIFFAKTPYTRKPDDVYNSNAEALKEGECGFGYILIEQGVANSTAGNAGQPVACTPLLNAQTNWEFDGNPFGGKAVVLRLDNSVDQPLIRESDNQVTVGKGRTIQETGPDSVWDDLNPVLAAPKKRGN